MNVGEPFKRRRMFSLVENIIGLQLQGLGYDLSSATNFKFTYCKLLASVVLSFFFFFSFGKYR